MKTPVVYTLKVQVLADALHVATCRHNHTDACGWYYDTWDKPGWEKRTYAEKAIGALEIADGDSDLVMAIVKVICE